MEWYIALALCIVSLIVLFLTGFPIAFCFLVFNCVGAVLIFGGEAGLHQLMLSLYDSVTRFVLLPIPLFLLMGEVVFQSGVAFRALDVLDKLLGRLPGRLGLITVAGGALFSTVGSSTSATSALLGRVLLPDMLRRGYKKPMSLGPILGSGGLAMIIPPSGQAVLLASLAGISVGKLLIAGIIPGIVMAFFYASYIILRCFLQPSVAPAYDLTPTPITEKIKGVVLYVLPLGCIFFLAVGFIFLGVTTPTEAAATGAIGTFIVAALYRRLNWEVVKRSVTGATRITIMLFMILLGAQAFSQILAFSGAARGLTLFTVELPLPAIFLHICMLLGVMFMGTFIDTTSIMMITLPIYMPIVHALHINPVWFGVTMLMSFEIGATSPPFGVILFVMKGVVPADITMGDIYRAALPFIGCDWVSLATVMTFPALALWLPSIM